MGQGLRVLAASTEDMGSVTSTYMKLTTTIHFSSRGSFLLHFPIPLGSMDVCFFMKFSIFQKTLFKTTELPQNRASMMGDTEFDSKIKLI